MSCQRYTSKKSTLPIPTVDYMTPDFIFLYNFSPLPPSQEITLSGINFRNNTVVTLGNPPLFCETLFYNSNTLGFYLPNEVVFKTGVYPVQVYNPNPQPNPGTLNTVGLTSNVVYLTLE
jgi:hypothetical protein